MSKIDKFLEKMSFLSSMSDDLIDELIYQFDGMYHLVPSIIIGNDLDIDTILRLNYLRGFLEFLKNVKNLDFLRYKKNSEELKSFKNLLK